MLLQKYFPDKIPNEVYVVVALALGVGLSTFLKLTFDNGLIIGFTAMGMYSTVSNGADVTKRAMKDM